MKEQKVKNGHDICEEEREGGFVLPEVRSPYKTVSENSVKVILE